MAKRQVILLTGFEPIGESDINPSILACRRLEGRIYNGFKIEVGEVALRFNEIEQMLVDLMDTHKPSAVVSTGQSSRAYISLERVAINLADASRIPYNCGAKPRDQRIIEDGPTAYFTGLPIRTLLERLTEAKIPAEISNTAGTFGCNQIFYLLMRHLDKRQLNIPAGFIHVPSLPEQVVEKKLPSMSLYTTAMALEVVVETLSSLL